MTNVSAGEQRLVLLLQSREQGKHDSPPWHWSDAVQAPQSPTTLCTPATETA
jgi:hypothetical protein